MDGPVNPGAVEDGLTNYFHGEQMGTAICWSHPEEKPSFLTKGHNRSIIMLSMYISNPQDLLGYSKVPLVQRSLL